VVEAHYPAVRKALNLLGESAPAMMTGSGACVFAAVDDEASAQQIASKTQAQFTTIVARGVNYRPTALAV
jgi:4-diphosphocytidyl-2-C-methyl-D-erythritol kinase